MIALVVVASATFVTAKADNKKDKKRKPVAQEVTLNNTNDSVSFAAGMYATKGLMAYITRQYGVDTTYVEYFTDGFVEGLAKKDSPEYKAFTAGVMIADMVEKNILPYNQENFKGSDVTIDADLFRKGFIAALRNDTSICDFEQAQELYVEQAQAANTKKTEAYKAENEAWLKQNATKPDVKTTPSGLQYKVITEGTGEKPQATDRVTVKYEGKLIDGTVFDSSYKRNPQTTSFACNQVIKGWTEALTMMPVGSKWELYIPQQLAYGERQAGNIKPFSTLIFTVELVEISNEGSSVESTSLPPTVTVKPAAPKTAPKTKTAVKKR